ncbi:MAG: cupin domain-containing protein [Terriglobia bacterium]|jgi:quercetin dioxygenase-like cupin family protein
MSVPLIHEDDVREIALPGRHLRWIVNGERLNAKHLSMCIIRVPPGETVRPAHSHPNGEEVIYVLRGSGRVMVDGAADAVRAGTAVLFPKGSVHMLQNNGTEEMKVVCFFAPASDLSAYRFFEDLEFPS